jgi:HAE1 family hydrophobic/amphiphilic exporter-1
LEHPTPVIIGAFALCVLSFIVLLPRLGSVLIPTVSQGIFEAQLTLPVGTPLEETAAVTRELEASLTGQPEVGEVSSRIGGELLTSEATANGPNNATITVTLKPGGGLEEREQRVVGQLRANTARIPSLDLLITHPTLFSFKQPIELVLKGNDVKELRRRSNEVELRLADLPMLADVESSVKPGYPELVIVFDRRRLARLGLTARDAAERLRTAVLGDVPTRFREPDRNVDIRLQLAEADRETIADLRRLVINPGQSVPVTLTDVADIRVSEGPAEIRRTAGSRAAIITADVSGADLKTADQAIRGILSDLGLIDGYDYVISGQRREMEQSLRSLGYALLLAVFLVYVVMASQFESLLHPLLILLTIPLALAGVIPVLWAIQEPLSVMVFLGLIVLAGIVVNNSIVLVDYANQLVRSGRPVREAVLEAAHTRLRPILMTSLTTILALVPMVAGWGEGAEMRRPMGITVMVGLSFATLITLGFIPVIYCLITRIHAAKGNDGTTGR